MVRILSTLSELRGRLGSFLIFRGQEVIGIILMAAGLSFALILFSYHASDPSLNRVGNIDIENWFGAYGAVIADLLYQFAGYGAWGIIPGLTALGWRYMRHASVARPILKFFLLGWRHHFIIYGSNYCTPSFGLLCPACGWCFGTGACRAAWRLA